MDPKKLRMGHGNFGRIHTCRVTQMDKSLYYANTMPILCQYSSDIFIRLIYKYHNRHHHHKSGKACQEVKT